MYVSAPADPSPPRPRTLFQSFPERIFAAKERMFAAKTHPGVQAETERFAKLPTRLAALYNSAMDASKALKPRVRSIFPRFVFQLH